MSKNDGGSAFPQACVYESESDRIHPPGEFPYEEIGGMSLRDWFAGRAMQGLLAAQAGQECEDCLAEDHLAAIAFHQADAMLVEREKDKSEPEDRNDPQAHDEPELD